VTIGVRRSGAVFSTRRRFVPTVEAPPSTTAGRGVPDSYALPSAPQGTLREIQLPADDKQIQALFAAAVPGDSFIMPNSRVLFSHEPTLLIAGTAANPISLRGTAASIFDSGSSGYGLHILEAHYNQVLGGVFEHNKKGIVLDNSKHCILRYARVAQCDQEAIHFRASSSDGLAEFCTIEGTGIATADFGEGFYVGTHDGNWMSEFVDRSTPVQKVRGVLGNEDGVDQSHRVIIQKCQIINTTGEGLDYKQGVFDVIVRDNDFFACGWSNANSADSAIDLKGDNALIENNDFYPLMPNGSRPTNPDTSLSYVQRSCIQARVLTAPYGHNHTIRNNRAHGTWDAYLFEAVSGSTGNTVFDDNTAPGAGISIANIALTPAGGGEPVDVSSGGVKWGGTGTVKPNIPGGWEPGNLLVMAVMVRALEIPSVPSGWTLQTSGMGTTLGSAIYTRVAQAGDSAPLVATTVGTDIAVGAFIVCIKQWAGAITVAADYDEDPDDPTCPSIPASAGSKVIRILGLADNQLPEIEPAGVTSLGSWSTTNIGSDAALGAWYGIQENSGQTGTMMTTFSSSDPWVGFTVVISSN
jgi:hypothetical protein